MNGPEQRRTLIVRLSAAGDIVHGLPVAHALKQAGPDRRIGWVVEDRFADLLRGCPDIDELFVLPRGAWRAGRIRAWIGALRELLDRVRAFAADEVLDLQGLAKSALTARIAGSKRRIGFASPDAREGAGLLYTSRVRPSATHVVDRNLELLGPMGFSDPDAGWPPPPEASEEVKTFLAGAGLRPGQYAAIHPGAGWPAKEWPPQRYEALLRGLDAARNLPVLVTWGGRREENLAARLVTSGGESCIMGPDVGLRELWSLLAGAQLCVAGDTGPLHMAAAAGVPCVALFGPTRSERNGPCGEAHEVLQGACPQHPACWKRRERAACRCMETIGVDAVLAACLRRLAPGGADREGAESC